MQMHKTQTVGFLQSLTPESVGKCFGFIIYMDAYGTCVMLTNVFIVYVFFV